MDAREQQSILTIALLAAFADGEKADHEREAIRRMAESLGHEPGGTGLAGIYQDVLLKRVTMADAASHLKDLGQRQLAYEMAVCVCDADGRQNAAEATFLAQLRQALALDPGQASELGRSRMPWRMRSLPLRQRKRWYRLPLCRPCQPRTHHPPGQQSTQNWTSPSSTTPC